MVTVLRQPWNTWSDYGAWSYTGAYQSPKLNMVYGMLARNSDISGWEGKHTQTFAYSISGYPNMVFAMDE
jgi:hypothetical protein